MSKICPHCGYKTQWDFAIKEHAKQHNLVLQQYFHCADELKEYKCSKCDFQASNLNSFKLHTNLKHQFKTDGNNVSTNKKWQKCPHCNFRTRYLSNWTRHILDYHTSNKQINQAKCNYFEVKMKHKLKHRYQRSKYFRCSFEATNEFDLLRHYRLKNYKLIKCQHCNFESLADYTMKQHVLYFHTPSDQIEWFHCDLCEFKAKSLANLKHHNTYQHRTDSFKCSNCPFITTKRRDLHIHKSKHEIELLKCPYCGYRTAMVSDLKNHTIECHISEERFPWFNCSDCKFKTKLKSNLISHRCKQKNSLFKCSDCSFEAASKAGLRIHKYEHDDKKFLKCPHCNYTTVCLSKVTKHILQQHVPD